MDSLPLSCSLGLPARHQLSPAGSLSHVRATSAPGQSTAGLPGKAIGQRWCMVDRCGDSNSTGSDADQVDAHEFAASPNNPNVECSGEPDRPDRQQTSESQQSDGDGSWQVVTRRSSGRQRQKAPAGKRKAWIKGGARAAPARQLPKNSSAGNGVTGQRQRGAGNDLGRVFSTTPCLHWPLCIKSFARLGEADWNTFHTCLMKIHHFMPMDLTRGDFLRFHHLMTEGPQTIRREDVMVFLVAPFKVMVSDDELSTDTIFLSLMFERAVPGFLKMLGDRFVGGLMQVTPRHGELFAAITELLARICRENDWRFDMLGWQHMHMRQRCNLFSSLIYLFKKSRKFDLIRKVCEHVNGRRLERFHYLTMQKLLHSPQGSDLGAFLRDLKASMRATLFWLEDQFFAISEMKERCEPIDQYASIVEKFFEVVDSLELQPDGLLYSMWQSVTDCSVHFRAHLNAHLGFDRTVGLLGRLLQHIQHKPSMDASVFELRLTLLGLILARCEGLLHERNCNLFSQAWHRFESELKSLLANCNQFLGEFPDACESLYSQRIKPARLDLSLKESSFHRLVCATGKASPQWIQENLARCREDFSKGWNLSDKHREAGTIELAKWCFLAGEHHAGVSSLLAVVFDNVKLSWRKANLLACHDVYQAAVEEFRHTKSLMTDPNKACQYKRDEVDDRIAMTQLHWYEADGNTRHLISAYHLSVDLLGRSDTEHRKRFEGGLAHIVIAMKNSGLRFEDYAGPTQVLGYLVKDGSGIKSWHHFADLLYLRHKVGLTDADTVDKVTNELIRKCRFFVDMGKKA